MKRYSHVVTDKKEFYIHGTKVAVSFRNNKRTLFSARLDNLNNVLKLNVGSKVSEKRIIDYAEDVYLKYFKQEKIINFYDGCPCHIFGNRYTFCILDGLKNDIKIYGDTIFFTQKDRQDEQKNRKFFINFLKKELKNKVEKMLPKWEQAVSIKFNKVVYTNTLSRWGSCNRQTRTLQVSIKCALESLDFLDMVLAHEVCHLIYLQHDKKFYDLLTKIAPNYRSIMAKNK